MLTLRPTRPADLDFVLSAEADEEVRPFIIPWTHDMHLAACGDPDYRHFIISAAEEPVGFAILGGIADPRHVIELKRIVITRRARGFGRRGLAAICDFAFNAAGATRVWLDVFEDNARARSLYLGAGFVDETPAPEPVRHKTGRRLGIMTLSRDRAREV